MNFHNIRNVGLPKDEADAVPRKFVEDMVNSSLKERKQLISVHARYCGPLKEGDYPFKFGGNTLEICEELFEKDYYLKALMSGFVMPHSGRIKKTICEGLAYINLHTMGNDLINSLNENQVNKLKKHYGKEDFKNDFIYDLKYRVDFNIYSHKPTQNEKSFFEIVKTRKIYSGPLGNFGVKPITVVFQHVKIRKFDWIQVEKSRDIHEVKVIMQISSDETASYIKKGDTLNIRISYFQNDLFSENNIIDDILKPAVMHLFSSLNFNFTFLIELDPL